MKEALADKPVIPFRVPNSIKLVKIDRTNGKYPSISTPKEKIFFEAFKLNDEITESENIDQENNNKEGKDDINDLLDDNQPNGIY